jgi:23S rRNA (uracil1939-C5)-methyltransferase
VSILGLDDDGVGVGRVAGHDVRVPLALPGERVMASVERRGREEMSCRLDKVLAASPDRVHSPCRHAGSCGACPLIAMSYPAQLRLKEQRIREALEAMPRLRSVTVHPVWAAPAPLGYRATAKLSVARLHGNTVIGMNRPGTREVVPTDQCPVHHPLVNAVAAALALEIRKQRIEVFDPATGRGFLRFVALRVSPSRRAVMATLVVTERKIGPLTGLAKGLQVRVPELVSVHGSVNIGDGGMVLGRESFRLLGAPDLHDVVGDVRLCISPMAFFQVNHAQAARIYAKVREWAALTKQETAIDVYCGIGGIAMTLARDAARVIGIEAVEGAVRDARANAKTNQIDNCSFRLGDAAAVLREVGSTARPAVVVLNPPRSGCEPGALAAAAALRPRTIVYVSCNPQTLARDLDVLAGRGYATQEVQGVDMFPQTGHVECIARLAPAPAPGV